jgi:hypothetical protein
MMRMRTGSWCFIGAIVCAGAGATPAWAQLTTVPQIAMTPAPSFGQAAARPYVELRGVVTDDLGSPLPGAVVSAQGATSAFAVSDHEGRFVLKGLPPGPYLLRAHLQNYLQSRGNVVQVGTSGGTSTISLTRRADASSPAVLAAGVGATDERPRSADGEAPHGHDERAWRLRRLKRSVLKEAEATLVDLDDEDSLLEGSLLTVGRAVGDSARLASTLFSDLSVNGQINLIASTTFDHAQELFTLSANAPNNVAYVAIEAPGANGDWTMRGTLRQGDLASWILAGSYVRRRPATHAYEAGVSFGMQRYIVGNGDALAVMPDSSRRVGAMYAMDNWTLSPQVSIGYGAKYARYDYLSDRGLVSPRATLTLRPSAHDTLALRTTVLHREVAPGAEEFLPAGMGPWLPPERTFSQVAGAPMVPERHDLIQVAVDREWGRQVVIGVRAFTERVENQVVTLFGVAVGDTPTGPGHYQIASAGDFGARGWGVTVARNVSDHVRATVDYTQAQTEWRRVSPDAESLSTMAPSALRSDERVHDLTASVESVVPSTWTRLLVVYKLNTAFSPVLAEANPGPSVRFDVQVNQALPFLNFMSAEWEMLVAVSNLFKEQLYENSVYDELLVVRPPKRVLGGVTVRF